MIPLGWAAIRAAVPILGIPRRLLMAPLLLFVCLGAFAVRNSLFGHWGHAGLRPGRPLDGSGRFSGQAPHAGHGDGTVGRGKADALLIKMQGGLTRYFGGPVATVLMWLWPLQQQVRR
jgi:hypothetical protein